MDKQIKKSKSVDPKGKYPFGFLMEIRDVTSPITVKRMQIIKGGVAIAVVLLVSFFIWQNFLKAPDGEKLVANMVEASGGLAAWSKIDHGKFTRTHRLFTNTGESISERKETFYFGRDDGKLKYMLDISSPDLTPVTIGKDKLGFWAKQEDKPLDPEEEARELGLMCDSKWCSPDCNMSMAFFRFSMPFKLLDNGVIAENGGKSALNNKEFQVLNISYAPEVGRDKWVFYTDPESDLIYKMEYHHYNDEGINKPEELFWTDYKDVNGLKISQKWTRYWSNGQVLEQYTFSDFDFESDLPTEFYERPDYLAAKE